MSTITASELARKVMDDWVRSLIHSEGKKVSTCKRPILHSSTSTLLKLKLMCDQVFLNASAASCEGASCFSSPIGLAEYSTPRCPSLLTACRSIVSCLGKLPCWLWCHNRGAVDAAG